MFSSYFYCINKKNVKQPKENLLGFMVFIKKMTSYKLRHKLGFTLEVLDEIL